MLIISDWNVKNPQIKPEEHSKGIIGKSGLDEKHERVETPLRIVPDSELRNLNTIFKHYPCGLSTWPLPSDNIQTK